MEHQKLSEIKGNTLYFYSAVLRSYTLRINSLEVINDFGTGLLCYPPSLLSVVKPLAAIFACTTVYIFDKCSDSPCEAFVSIET